MLLKWLDESRESTSLANAAARAAWGCGDVDEEELKISILDPRITMTSIRNAKRTIAKVNLSVPDPDM